MATTGLFRPAVVRRTALVSNGKGWCWTRNEAQLPGSGVSASTGMGCVLHEGAMVGMDMYPTPSVLLVGTCCGFKYVLEECSRRVFCLSRRVLNHTGAMLAWCAGVK